MDTEHVVHEIKPVYNQRSAILILGTMPSPKSREEGFYYGNPRNRFWKVLSIIFDEPLPETTDEKIDFCLRHNIALWDVLASCDIHKASDSSIKNPVPNEINSLLAHAPIQAIFTTGTKAHALYAKLCEPHTHLPSALLASTSPANSRISLSELCAQYQRAFAPYLSFEPTRATLDVADVVKLEHALAHQGTSLYTLMQRAGKFLAYEVNKLFNPSCLFPRQSTKRTTNNPTDFYPAHIVILCGHGNNGGDGWVAADYLTDSGYHVDLISSIKPCEIKADPAHTTAEELNETLQKKSNFRLFINPTYDEIVTILSQTDCIVDALLGTGFTGDTLREPFASWVQLVNTKKESGTFVVAADVPSGFSAQTGAAASPTIRADHTVTMIVSKTGFKSLTAKEHCGAIHIAPLADISEVRA